MRRLLSILAVLLLALPLYGQGHISIRRAAGGTPLDWTSSMVSVHRCEEDTGATRESDDDATCGASNCDLADTNTVVKDTTNFIEGSASCDTTIATGNYLSCDMDATCTALEITPSLTYGGWYRADGDLTTNRFLLSATDASNTAYQIRWQRFDTPARNFDCRIFDDITGAQLTEGDTSYWAAAEWVHVVCQLIDDGDDEIHLFTNGTDDDGGTVGTIPNGFDAWNTANETFEIPGSGDPHTGQSDEVFVFDGGLTAAQICRICGCGIDGTAGPCTCSGTAYNDKGRFSDGTGECECASAAAGDCNAAAP